MLNLPELSAAKTSPIRIPGELDVPVTRRVRHIIDTPPMQRLKRVSQLGLVSQVYPGATHSRFEHSLGVYRLACKVLEHLLASQPSFAKDLTEQEATTFLLAALLHDVGHWPYCHPIEDLCLDWVPKHEVLARELICNGELAERIEQEWDVRPEAVADFLAGNVAGPAMCVLQNVMNGPIDVDKMDYLQRDSLHAGVPYGQNFDLERLIGSICVGQDNRSIAISEKGKTAAEMMVFARYVMFSEVYWHHTVRAATAMLQRLIYSLAEPLNPSHWLALGDSDFAKECISLCQNSPELSRLANGLFGTRRSPYKRFAQFGYLEFPQVHQALAGLPYGRLVSIAERLTDRLARYNTGEGLSAIDVLIDAPPVKLEVQFNLNVNLSAADHDGLATHFVALSDLSPVVKTLALQQFDNFVKRVRVFMSPRLISSINIDSQELAELLVELSDESLKET